MDKKTLFPFLSLIAIAVGISLSVAFGILDEFKKSSQSDPAQASVLSQEVVYTVLDMTWEKVGDFDAVKIEYTIDNESNYLITVENPYQLYTGLAEPYITVRDMSPIITVGPKTQKSNVQYLVYTSDDDGVGMQLGLLGSDDWESINKGNLKDNRPKVKMITPETEAQQQAEKSGGMVSIAQFKVVDDE